MFLGLLLRGVEELASLVDPVDSAVGQAGVHLGFDADGVVGEEQGVHVIRAAGRLSSCSPTLRCSAPPSPHMRHQIATLLW